MYLSYMRWQMLIEKTCGCRPCHAGRRTVTVENVDWQNKEFVTAFLLSLFIIFDAILTLFCCLYNNNIFSKFLHIFIYIKQIYSIFYFLLL